LAGNDDVYALRLREIGDCALKLTASGKKGRKEGGRMHGCLFPFHHQHAIFFLHMAAIGEEGGGLSLSFLR
jgi:hypothetical protein